MFELAKSFCLTDLGRPHTLHIEQGICLRSHNLISQHRPPAPPHITAATVNPSGSPLRMSSISQIKSPGTCTSSLRNAVQNLQQLVEIAAPQQTAEIKYSLESSEQPQGRQRDPQSRSGASEHSTASKRLMISSCKQAPCDQPMQRVQPGTDQSQSLRAQRLGRYQEGRADGHGVKPQAVQRHGVWHNAPWDSTLLLDAKLTVDCQVFVTGNHHDT